MKLLKRKKCEHPNMREIWRRGNRALMKCADCAHARYVSVDDTTFAQRLMGPIYEDSSDVARFILATLTEDAMTKESTQDLWQRERGHYVWTIEHILPQGTNLPQAWVVLSLFLCMMGTTKESRNRVIYPVTIIKKRNTSAIPIMEKTVTWRGT